MKGKMVCGDGRLQCGKDKNFPRRADLEDSPAAIADVEILLAIECQPGGDAHTLDPLFNAAIGRNAMYGAVVSAGNKKTSRVVEREAARIRQRCDKRLDAEICGDFVKRDGNPLAARPAEGDVGVALGVDGRIRDRVKVVGDLQTDRDRKGLALLGTGADTNCPAANPAVDAEGNTYVTFSGPRGQRVPV